MRRVYLLFLLLAAPLFGAPGEPVEIPPDQVTVVPTQLPGLELRTLDKCKVLRFQIGGRLAEVEVPIFAYVPVDESTQIASTARLLRSLSDKLANELTTPEVDRVAVREVAQTMEAIIAELVGEERSN